MREFDAICPPPVREFSAADIKRLREALKFSQPVFALHLHTTASTVRKWEQGATHPTLPALKLLNVIADKGLQAFTRQPAKMRDHPMPEIILRAGRAGYRRPSALGGSPKPSCRALLHSASTCHDAG